MKNTKGGIRENAINRFNTDHYSSLSVTLDGILLYVADKSNPLDALK
jgi:hypothetical protein